MTEIEELDNLLVTLKKYNLPISPILEYAIKEKMAEFPEQDNSCNTIQEDKNEDEMFAHGTTDIVSTMDKIQDNPLRIVNYGKRSIAVVGKTKPHKDALKAMGGYFVFHSQWGPAWIFRSKKYEQIQAYINGDTSTVLSGEQNDKDFSSHKRYSRYIIRVKYPNGRVFCSEIVWETLVDVVKYAGPRNVQQLNITCMGDNLVSERMNPNPLYRSAQKRIEDNLLVCTYSSTDTKYKQIAIINQNLQLGLRVDKIYTNDESQSQTRWSENSIATARSNNSRRRGKSYSFEGVIAHNKRRFVFEVVKYYIHSNPSISYDELIKQFPPELNYNKANGVIQLYSNVERKCEINHKTRNYFFLKPEDILELSDGTKVVVHSQWGDDFSNFLEVARKLYQVQVME